jgi:hypothetical protein
MRPLSNPGLRPSKTCRARAIFRAISTASEPPDAKSGLPAKPVASSKRRTRSSASRIEISQVKRRGAKARLSIWLRTASRTFDGGAEAATALNMRI